VDKIRVRFAPSPTGYLHIGGARTALFNWFFARQNGGSFVLRIEDTDRERLKEDSVSQILDSLRWLGIDWDEGPEAGGDYGPYFQSQRTELYAAAARELLDSGKAYYCFCSAEELEAEREIQRKEGRAIGYGGKCRDLSAEEVRRRLEQGLKPVLRIRMPDSGPIVVEDIIRGSVNFDHDLFDDFVIMKSNGLPAYNFACVVDDSAMEITHVIRAEEHLPNTPRQQFLYEALGRPVPEFAHLSMILAPDRSKLSKRHGATSVSEFRDMGCLPEAIVNYLTLLGWSSGEESSGVLSPEYTLKNFSLEKVSKTAAVYDTQKLLWLNGQYIRDYDLEALAGQALPFFAKEGIAPPTEMEEDRRHFIAVIRAVRDRARTLPEIADACRYFFEEVTFYDESGRDKYFKAEGALDLLSKCAERLAALDGFTAESTEKTCRDLAEELGIKAGAVIHPVRLALTGRTATPGLFDVMVLLGREKCLERLDRATAFIREHYLRK